MNELTNENHELRIAELTDMELDSVAGGNVPSDPGGGGGGGGSGGADTRLGPVIARVAKEVLTHL